MGTEKKPCLNIYTRFKKIHFVKDSALERYKLVEELLELSLSQRDQQMTWFILLLYLKSEDWSRVQTSLLICLGLAHTSAEHSEAQKIGHGLKDQLEG